MNSSLKAIRVLIVDDEPDVRGGLKRLVAAAGPTVETAASGEEALALLEKQSADLVITDIRMPGISGMELLSRIRESWPQIEVVLMSGFGTIEMAVQGLQNGASHFLPKPFDNREITNLVETVIGRIAERRQDLSGGAGSGSMVATDSSMKPVLAMIAQVAPTRVPVLVEGESGTGKELVAREVHRQSLARDLPFQAVNCAALPDTLLESELFGFKKGSFTGANKDHDGLFCQAQGGTVFLDEISSMSLAFQSKLLRVLEEKVVRPLGAVRDEPVSFRLVTASNRDLLAMVQDGSFREDLYYRIQVINIALPPLRERAADIPLLAERFLREARLDINGDADKGPSLSDGAMRALAQHNWPGNVRELENAMQRAVIVCREGDIQAKHLDLRAVDKPMDGQVAHHLSYEDAKQDAVARFQRAFVTRAPENSGGNVSQAAEACGMTRAALQRIMRSLDLAREDFSP